MQGSHPKVRALRSMGSAVDSAGLHAARFPNSAHRDRHPGWTRHGRCPERGPELRLRLLAREPALGPGRGEAGHALPRPARCPFPAVLRALVVRGPRRSTLCAHAPERAVCVRPERADALLAAGDFRGRHSSSNAPLAPYPDMRPWRTPGTYASTGQATTGLSALGSSEPDAHPCAYPIIHLPARGVGKVSFNE